MTDLRSTLLTQLRMHHDVGLDWTTHNATILGRTAPTGTSHGLCLDHGVGRVATRERTVGVRRGRVKECFSNAARLVFRDPTRFVYCEGYAVRSSLGLVIGEHAWCLDVYNGYAVCDPTWRGVKGAVFLGIPFAYEYLCEKVTASGYYGLLCNPRLGCAPLQNAPSEFLHQDYGLIPTDFVPGHVAVEDAA